MARETLDLKLHHLYDGILVMDSMVEVATLRAVQALIQHDLATAREIYEADRELNNKRFELENDLIITIATTQPIMSSDLRKVASIYEVISELERMGDYTKGIAKITFLMGEFEYEYSFAELTRMAGIAVHMLSQAIGAFLSGDIDAAQRIPAEDDRVDLLYNNIYKGLMKTISDQPNTLEHVNHILWAANNLERLADRVINICERTIYNVTGKLLELDKSDDELALLETLDR